jgi:hypothetical protein
MDRLTELRERVESRTGEGGELRRGKRGERREALRRTEGEEV